MLVPISLLVLIIYTIISNLVLLWILLYHLHMRLCSHIICSSWYHLVHYHWYFYVFLNIFLLSLQCSSAPTISSCLLSFLCGFFHHRVYLFFHLNFHLHNKLLPSNNRGLIILLTCFKNLIVVVLLYAAMLSMALITNFWLAYQWIFFWW